MIYEGYIKLWRATLESSSFQNEGLFKVWIWCLLKACHSPTIFSFQTGRGYSEVKLDTAQFVFGRYAASKELNMKPSTLVKRIIKLEKLGNITTQSNTHYSIITICNWSTYQISDDDLEQAKEQARNRQGTGKEQARNTYKNNIIVSKVKKPTLDTCQKSKFRYSDDDKRMVVLLIDLMNSNKPDRKQETDAVKKSWANECRLMRERDGRTLERIEAVIRWAQADSFCKKNILSFGKLRAQFDKLELDMRDKKQTSKAERPKRYEHERPASEYDNIIPDYVFDNTQGLPE